MRRLLLTMVLVGCGGASTSSADTTAESSADTTAESSADTTAKMTATLSGRVTLVEGDCMPPESRDSCIRSTPSRGVYLFPVQYFDDVAHTFPTELDVAPVAQTISDADGQYSMNAPPGRWSVFVEDEGKLYANGYTSVDNAIEAVELVADVETTRDIQINHATW
jgi:hypothetical protein